MTDRLQYGTTAKVFHWLVVALLLMQYPIGWLMPDIHRGMSPGAPMTFHVSLGIVVLALIILRFAWRWGIFARWRPKDRETNSPISPRP